MKLINQFYSKIVGSTFCDGQKYIPNLKPGDLLNHLRDKNNIYDSNAIAIYDGEGRKLGFIPKDTAATLAPIIDNQLTVYMKVSEVTGGNEKNVGCNIKIEVWDKERKFKFNGDMANHFNDMQDIGNAECDATEIDLY